MHCFGGFAVIVQSGASRVISIVGPGLVHHRSASTRLSSSERPIAKEATVRAARMSFVRASVRGEVMIVRCPGSRGSDDGTSSSSLRPNSAAAMIPLTFASRRVSRARCRRRSTGMDLRPTALRCGAVVRPACRSVSAVSSRPSQSACCKTCRSFQASSNSAARSRPSVSASTTPHSSSRSSSSQSRS